MARQKSAGKSPSAGKAESAVKPRRRKRQSDVKGRVLRLLSSGPLATPELLKRGKFSPAALYLNLKALRAEGLVTSQRDGRTIVIGLASTQASAPMEGEVITPTGDHRKAASETRVEIAPELQKALDAIALRLSPTSQIREKLIVLDHLSRNVPVQLSEVLRSLIEDLAKLTDLASIPAA